MARNEGDGTSCRGSLPDRGKRSSCGWPWPTDSRSVSPLRPQEESCDLLALRAHSPLSPRSERRVSTRQGTRNAGRCDVRRSLATIGDQHTRCLLTCHAICSTHGVLARRVFERAFRDHALATAIGTDNVFVTFATPAIHRPSDLNVWRMHPGIERQRIRPGCRKKERRTRADAQQAHRTLKRGTIRPARATLAAQQRAYNSFRRECDDERPAADCRRERSPCPFRSGYRPEVPRSVKWSRFSEQGG